MTCSISTDQPSQTAMPWLVCDGRRVAPLEVAVTMAARSHGLLGRDSMAGAILLQPALSVHTLRMRFAIDVAFCDLELTVLDTITMHRNRVGRPRLRARAVLEAEAGAFALWGLAPGSHLGIDYGP